ncbi:MAG: hypothetical protein QNJ72_11495 [Pleurocapsa sp. MO_226.B13]|nr:hypothetical protein [Pleurocapsa sp. MO_226.B13]
MGKSLTILRSHFKSFNPTTEAHFYTPSAAEKEVVENELSDFQFEGIAYYAFPVEEVN